MAMRIVGCNRAQRDSTDVWTGWTDIGAMPLRRIAPYGCPEVPAC